MPACIRVETLDGKVLHRTRSRARRLVDSGTHRWVDEHIIREIIPQATRNDSFRDYARQLLPQFEFTDYPANDPCLAEAFQRAMKYPVELAKDQRSLWAHWTIQA